MRSPIAASDVAVSNGGHDSGYGIITGNPSDALVNVFACGTPSSAVTIGAPVRAIFSSETPLAELLHVQNAQTVDGSNAIGLIAPYYPNGGSPNMGAGSAKYVDVAVPRAEARI